MNNKVHNSSVGAEETRSELEDRDPNNINRHIQVTWDDVIGEPYNIRSPECAWRLSGICFRLSKSFCYVFLSVLIAPVVALLLGLSFACLAFQHVWCVAPGLRMWTICCSSIRDFWTATVLAIVRPCTESCGYFFNNIRFLRQQVPLQSLSRDRLDNVHLI